MAKGVTPQSTDASKWYTDVITKAQLADYGPVKGTMVIRPYGYSIWESIKDAFDQQFKATGHTNAYFPLFIPKSFLAKEAEHVEGFAKECAVVTHSKLKVDDNKQLVVDPASKLEEEIIVRPTSETVIWSMYKKWINSYRDLPILINQWANVVRWEMRTRLFLRTAEFLWQEGHTAHQTKDEAMEEALMINSLYAEFAEKFMSMPVIQGLKSENERFAGAEETFCIEALMQDGKALQAGTSHFLGQNFAKAFDVKFSDKEGKLNYVWATSWGVSSRLMGALIMTHSDDKGLVLPPKLAPNQVVIVPIYNNEDDLKSISEIVDKIKNDLTKLGISVKYDNRDTLRPGAKFAQHELQGVPIRIAIGPKDIENNSAEVSRRDLLSKQNIAMDDLVEYIDKLLIEIQENLYKKALKFREDHTTEVDSFDEFKKVLEEKGGFISAHWDGTNETEDKIKELTKATIRCIPNDQSSTKGKCVYSGKSSNQRVLFAKAY